MRPPDLIFELAWGALDKHCELCVREECVPQQRSDSFLGGAYKRNFGGRLNHVDSLESWLSTACPSAELSERIYGHNGFDEIVKLCCSGPPP